MYNEDLTIRRAARHEISAIEAVGVAAYTEFSRQVPPPIFSAYIDDLRQLQSHWDEAEVMVAEVGGIIAGSVLFYADASTEGLGLPKGWTGFRKLAVRPDMRGRSLGRSLVNSCVERSRQLEAPAVGIHTVSFMTAACTIYEQIGFHRCPEYDLTAADMLAVDTMDEIKVLTYRLDLACTDRKET